MIQTGARRPARPRSPARKLQRLTETDTRSVPGRYQTFSAGTLASDTGWLEKAAVTEKVYQRYGDFVTDILKHAGEPPLHLRPAAEVDWVMADFMGQLFQEGASSNHGNYLMAAWAALSYSRTTGGTATSSCRMHIARSRAGERSGRCTADLRMLFR